MDEQMTEIELIYQTGYILASGTMLCVSSDGELSVIRGRKIARAKLNPLQWQLLAMCLSSDAKGRRVLEIDDRHLVIVNKRDIITDLIVGTMNTSVIAPLRHGRETDDLVEIARFRAPSKKTNKETA